MGLPFINAAKMVHPERVAANITGDGATGCTYKELETAQERAGIGETRGARHPHRLHAPSDGHLAGHSGLPGNGNRAGGPRLARVAYTAPISDQATEV